MSLITIIIALVVVGVILWLIGQIPMDATIKQIINIVVLIAVVLWLLKAFGLLASLSAIKV